MSENSLKVSNVDSGGDGDNNGCNNKFLETFNQLKEGEEFLFDSGDTKKFTKDTNIDEIYNQIKNLEIPNNSTSFLEIKDDLTEKINQIILGMHSFIEKHGIQEIEVNIISEFLGKVYDFFNSCALFVKYLKSSRLLLDERILKCLYQIFGKLKQQKYDYTIKSIDDRLSWYTYLCFDHFINEWEISAIRCALSKFFDIFIYHYNIYQNHTKLSDGWKHSFRSLMNTMAKTENSKTKEIATVVINDFIGKLFDQSSLNTCGLKFNQNSGFIEDDKNVIDVNIYNDILPFFYFDDDLYLSKNNWIDVRMKYIEKQIDVLKEKKLNDQRHSVFYTSKYEYKFFGIEPAEFFAGDDEKVKEFKRYLDYTKHIQNNLISIWKRINEQFHEYNELKQTNSKKFDQKLYERIKQDRANIYDLLCQVEAEKQKLLKEQLLSFREKKFGSMKLSGTEKFFRIILLIATFPIHAPIFIFVRTVIEFLNCFMMSFEIICGLINGVRNKKKYGIFDFKTCKDDWSNHCKKKYLDGIKINGQEICKRIKWWEKRWCRIFRDIFFPINLLVFTVIGIFLAIRKFFVSIIKVWGTTKRVFSDIYYDGPSLYMFKTKQIIMPRGTSETAVNFNGRISVLPKYDGSNVKLKNKFIDCTCPIVSYYDFAEKPKSAWEHLKCLIGIQSIKSVKYYNRYAHKNSSTPRLEYVPEECVVMKR